MRQVREILRLTYEAALPSREVARRVGTGSTSVRVMLQRFRASELNWPLPADTTDTALEHALYGVADHWPGIARVVQSRAVRSDRVDARVFFHLYNDLMDDEGSDLPDIHAAREYAITNIRELICEDVHKGRVNLRHRIEVADAAGTRLLKVAFGEVVEVQA